MVLQHGWGGCHWGHMTPGGTLLGVALLPSLVPAESNQSAAPVTSKGCSETRGGCSEQPLEVIKAQLLIIFSRHDRSSVLVAFGGGVGGGSLGGCAPGLHTF